MSVVMQLESTSFFPFQHFDQPKIGMLKRFQAGISRVNPTQTPPIIQLWQFCSLPSPYSKPRHGLYSYSPIPPNPNPNSSQVLCLALGWSKKRADESREGNSRQVQCGMDESFGQMRSGDGFKSEMSLMAINFRGCVSAAQNQSVLLILRPAASWQFQRIPTCKLINLIESQKDQVMQCKKHQLSSTTQQQSSNTLGEITHNSTDVFPGHRKSLTGSPRKTLVSINPNSGVTWEEGKGWVAGWCAVGVLYLLQIIQVLLQSIKLLSWLMASKYDSCTGQTPVYGFLCQSTNVFYAFETFEQYQEFLGWLQACSQSQSQPSDSAMASQEELERNYQEATDNIMEVFKDPLFQAEGANPELEEIDF